MCRLVKKRVYGVLTDYDLSSWKEDLKNDYTKTSQQRTGTPPYMAGELLQGAPIHLYRHDVESLFYIMLLLGSRHTISPTPDADGKAGIVMRREKLPYQKWFNQQDYRTLGSIKHDFILKKEAIELSSDFEDFRLWLDALRFGFLKGIKSDPDEGEPVPLSMLSRVRSTQTPTSFDKETLGGFVDYFTVIDPIRHLKRTLRGLTVRYRPPKARVGH